MDDLSERQGEVVREFLPQSGTRDKVEHAVEMAIVPVFAILAVGLVVTEPQVCPYLLVLTTLFALLCLRLWRFRRPMRYVFRSDGERLECLQGSVLHRRH